MKRIEDIENQLERAAARYDRLLRIEAVEKERTERMRRLKTYIGQLLIAGAITAILLQF
jgi:hypothetical protein